MTASRSLDQFIRKCGPEASVCGACSESFECGARAGSCWCSEISLSEPLRAELRERFKGCLCRACLEKFSEAGSVETARAGQGGSELGTSR